MVKVAVLFFTEGQQTRIIPKPVVKSKKKTPVSVVPDYFPRGVWH